MPRAVMALSSRYPQLLCILTRFLAKMHAATAIRIARIMLNDAQHARSSSIQNQGLDWPMAVRVR
jgi:hypothetical protein